MNCIKEGQLILILIIKKKQRNKMKNIIKTLIVLASVVTFSSANAGVLEVTGTAKATYNISSSESGTASNDAGKGVGITNELAFTGTGELDNGYTWKYQVELDDDTSGSTTSDDTRLELTTPYGAVAAYNTEGSLNTKYTFSAAAYGAGTDNGATGGMTYGSSIDAYNNLQYHTPAGLLPYSIQGKVAYAPSADKGKNSGNSAGAQDALADGTKVTQYQLTASPIDGLNLFASYMEKSGELGTAQGYESGGLQAKYAWNAFTIGYGESYLSNPISNEITSAVGTELNTAALLAQIKEFKNDAISIGFKVNDNLSLSYEEEKSVAGKTTLAVTGNTENDVTLSVNTIQAAYSMGGMTLSLSSKDIENQNYALGKDAKETLVVVAMSF
jgi:hypothetical protein